MTTVQEVCQFLDEFAPRHLAEEWDNVGLLVGDRQAEIRRIMTCLTITPASTAEAVKEGVDMIVTHHPLPFQAFKRLTTDSPSGTMLLKLIRAGVSIYSPHTAFDSTRQGINQQLAAGIGLSNIVPLIDSPEDSAVGAGRYGRLPDPVTLAELAQLVKLFLRIERVRVVGEASREVQRVATACGSAGQFLSDARRTGCDALVTGETNFHTCLEAEATNTCLILTGHFASERFAVETLAERLASAFSGVTVWASRDEADPLVIL